MNEQESGYIYYVYYICIYVTRVIKIILLNKISQTQRSHIMWIIIRNIQSWCGGTHLWEAEARVLQFKASLDHISGPCGFIQSEKTHRDRKRSVTARAWGEESHTKHSVATCFLGKWWEYNLELNRCWLYSTVICLFKNN